MLIQLGTVNMTTTKTHLLPKLSRVLFITPRGLFTPSNLDISLRYDSEDEHYILYRVNRERCRHFPGTG